jgi:predicted lactoylglutathione lyase
MSTRIHCITLAVDDLKKAHAFYRDGAGLPMPDINDETDHIPIELPGNLYLVLVRRADFTQYTKLTNQTDTARGSSECILSYFAASKEAVDALLKRVEAAGGTVPSQATDQPWGYAGFFTDPDGHMWEIVWNPNFPAES